MDFALGCIIVILIAFVMFKALLPLLIIGGIIYLALCIWALFS